MWIKIKYSMLQVVWVFLLHWRTVGEAINIRRLDSAVSQTRSLQAAVGQRVHNSILSIKMTDWYWLYSIKEWAYAHRTIYSVHSAHSNTNAYPRKNANTLTGVLWTVQILDRIFPWGSSVWAARTNCDIKRKREKSQRGRLKFRTLPCILIKWAATDSYPGGASFGVCEANENRPFTAGGTQPDATVCVTCAHITLMGIQQNLK